MPETKEPYITSGKPAAHLDDYEFFDLEEELVNDWRWARVQHLGLFFLDQELIKKQAAFVQAQVELDDALAFVRETKTRLESREGMVRRGIDEKKIWEGTTRSTKGERESKRESIVEADQDYQSRKEAYDKAVTIRDKAQSDRDFAEMETKNVRMRLNWRTRLLDFISTIRPIPLDRVPDDKGVILALQEKPKPQMSMSVQTRDWLGAMSNLAIRYGNSGKLARLVLPEGVDSAHPKVVLVLQDIRKHFGNGPTL